MKQMESQDHRETWAIWWCLEPAEQRALKEFQWDVWGFLLHIPRLPSESHIDTELEGAEEIDQLMKIAPRVRRPPK